MMMMRRATTLQKMIVKMLRKDQGAEQLISLLRRLPVGPETTAAKASLMKALERIERQEEAAWQTKLAAADIVERWRVPRKIVRL